MGKGQIDAQQFHQSTSNTHTQTQFYYELQCEIVN